jgi:hypothetical protein
METCKNCEYFISTFKDEGICTLNDAYVNQSESCEDWEDTDD